MPDQIIDAVMACALQADAMRTHPLVGWIVMRGQPDDPDAVIARLVTDAATSYVLRADTAVAIHALLPPGLQRSARQPADPSEVVAVWLPK